MQFIARLACGAIQYGMRRRLGKVYAFQLRIVNMIVPTSIKNICYFINAE